MRESPVTLNHFTAILLKHRSRGFAVNVGGRSRRVRLTYRFLGVKCHFVDGAGVTRQLVQDPAGCGVPDIDKSVGDGVKRRTRQSEADEFGFFF